MRAISTSSSSTKDLEQFVSPISSSDDGSGKLGPILDASAQENGRTRAAGKEGSRPLRLNGQFVGRPNDHARHLCCCCARNIRANFIRSSNAANRQNSLDGNVYELLPPDVHSAHFMHGRQQKIIQETKPRPFHSFSCHFLTFVQLFFFWQFSHKDWHTCSSFSRRANAPCPSCKAANNICLVTKTHLGEQLVRVVTCSRYRPIVGSWDRHFAIVCLTHTRSNG